MNFSQNELTLCLMETPSLLQVFPFTLDTLLSSQFKLHQKCLSQHISHARSYPNFNCRRIPQCGQAVCYSCFKCFSGCHPSAGQSNLKRLLVARRRMNNVFLFDWKQLLYSRCDVCTPGWQCCSIFLIQCWKRWCTVGNNKAAQEVTANSGLQVSIFRWETCLLGSVLQANVMVCASRLQEHC